jgi:enoyl-CoA hydratase/carnithine racemase
MQARTPASLHFERRDAIGLLRLDRAAKRNALNDPTVEGLRDFFAAPPEGLRAVVLHGAGDHFCAGLDLSELNAMSAAEGVLHSRMWHEAFARIQFGTVPIVAVLHGAVVGGGLELACSAHVRVAEPSAFYALPEAQRGIFVGGGGSVRLPRIIGAHRMADMMPTGRVSAEEGHAWPRRLEPGQGRKRSRSRRRSPQRADDQLRVMHALPRIAELGQTRLFMESSSPGSRRASRRRRRA